MGRGQSGQWSEGLLCPVTHMENWHESLVYTPWICTVAAIIRQNLLLSPAFPLGAAALNWLWCYVEHLQRYVWDSLLSAQNMADRCCCSSRRLHCTASDIGIPFIIWPDLNWWKSSSLCHTCNCPHLCWLCVWSHRWRMVDTHCGQSLARLLLHHPISLSHISALESCILISVPECFKSWYS